MNELTNRYLTCSDSDLRQRIARVKEFVANELENQLRIRQASLRSEPAELARLQVRAPQN
jgi:hypothetical protein